MLFACWAPLSGALGARSGRVWRPLRPSWGHLKTFHFVHRGTVAEFGGYWGHGLAISSDGARILAGIHGWADYAWVIDGANGAPLFKVTGNSAGRFGWSAAINSDGSRVAVGAPNDDTVASNAGAVYVIDGDNTTLFKVSPADGVGNGQFGYALAMSSDGTRIAVGSPKDNSNSGSLYVINGTNGETLFKVMGEGQFGSAVAISSDGSRIAVGAFMDDGYRGSVSIIDGGSGTTLFKVTGVNGEDIHPACGKPRHRACATALQEGG